MAIGAVKFDDAGKGFGSIHPEDGDRDGFVRLSAPGRRGLNGPGDGPMVSFETEVDRRNGKVAIGAAEPA